MSAFVDASVLVAIMAGEPDERHWLDQLQSTADAITSPVAIWETVRATARILDAPIAMVADRLSILLDGLGIEIVHIGDIEAGAALVAHDRYGKGSHPAKLNLGDCFAYACAKTNNAILLYKGNDFSKTDLA